MSGTAVVEESAVIASGSTVIVRDVGETEQMRYTIVSPPEAAPLLGRISELSPLGFALLGHQAGETVRYRTPGGKREAQIISVHPER